MIDFPNSPTVGQQYTAAGVTWQWDGVKWTPTGMNQACVPLAGGTMTGPLILSGDPTVPLGAVDKQYVDALPDAMNDNRIINGDMRIDQRNNGSAGTATGVYTVDRWKYGAAQASKLTWQRITGSAPINALGFGYYLGFTSSSAYASVATDYFQVYQMIEADMITDFAWGTASAQPVTLSFLVLSSLTGIFGGAVQNAASNRSYPFSYSIPTAGIWTKIVVTIPGDTGGTWVMSGNAGGALVTFDLGNGSTYRGPANAWVSANYLSVPGAVSVVGTNGATFQITGVKLEIGSVATPFNHPPLAQALATCQRYFEKSWGPDISIGTATLVDITQNFLNGLPSAIFSTAIGGVFKTTKRAQATLTVYNPNSGAAGTVRDYNNNVDLTASSTRTGLTTFQINVTTTVAAVSLNVAAHWTASAEL